MRQTAQLVLISLILGAVSLALNPPTRAVLLDSPQPDEISVTEANTYPGDILWIDARGLGAYEAGHVQGALLLNEDHWQEQFAPVIERWKPGTMVLVYCDEAACTASRKVAERLRSDAGISPVYVLKGDWTAIKRTL